MAITATGSPTSLQYSNNGTTWSPWTNYVPSFFASLTSYGGTTSAGTKRVDVRLRDAAGNVGLYCTDTIVYLRQPQITGGTTTSLTNVTRGYYRLTGSGFTGADRVDFGTKVITSLWSSKHEDWWGEGAFRLISDGVIYVYPPQGLAPGKYGVRVRNPLLGGNAFNVAVFYETGRKLYCNSTITAGSPLTINVARSSSEPATTPCIIDFSPHRIPSVAPGIVSLEIGNNFSTLFEFPVMPFHPTTRTLTVTVPTLTVHKGLTVYLEAVYLRNPLPIPTTNSWRCVIQ